MTASTSTPVLAGKYTLLRRLGAGGMAEVFLARQAGMEGFEKLVVIKRVLPRHAKDQDFSRMFLDEARTAADLRHPNVVNIFEVGAQDGAYFMAMEFLHGHNVAHVIKRCLEMAQGLPLDVAGRIIMDAAAGLHHAHTKKDLRGNELHIVHRDVSPQNILVTFDGVTKILDFGIATARSRREDTGDGFIKGKLAYMSPEQAQGQAVDARTDQFALGVVLYELTTLRRLFQAPTPGETLALVVGNVVPRPTAVVEGYPPALEAVVLRALAPQPDHRFHSCQQLALALEDVLTGLGKVPSQTRTAATMERLFRESLEAEKLLAIPHPEDFSDGEVTPGERGAPPHAAAPPPDATVRLPRGPQPPVDESTHLLNAVQDFLMEAHTNQQALRNLAAFATTPVKARRSNITPPPGALVGRKAELQRVRVLLDDARVASISGAPGMGKTRLAVAVASSFLEDGAWSGGAWMADCSLASDASGICRAVAHALELPAVTGEDTNAMVAHVGRLLAARGPLLIILDQVDRAAAAVELAVRAWLAAAPQLCVLLTGPNVPSLGNVELGPLAFPQPGQKVAESESVQMLLQRAAALGARDAADADPLVLAQIVQALDGIPLAMELAAARLKDMPADELLAALPSERTLDHALAWAWNLLTPVEQSTLAQLSVFATGFTLDAAEAVVDLSAFPDAPPVATVVRALRNRSLVRAYVPPDLPTEVRLGLYDCVRVFVAPHCPPDAGVRHSRFFLTTAQSWCAGLSRHGGAERQVRLTLEQHNLHAVLQRSLRMPPGTPGRAATVGHVVLALDSVLTARGPAAAHLALLDAALAQTARQPVEETLQAQLLDARGNARRNQGQLSAAVEDLKDAAAMALRSHDRGLVARVRLDLGVAHFLMGRLEDAAQGYRQALAIARDVRDRIIEGRALCFLGIFHVVQGQLAEAQEHYQKALALVQETGDHLFEGRVLGNLGAVALERGQHVEARQRFSQAMAIFQDMRDRRLEGYYASKFAQAFHLEGALQDARGHYEHALTLLRGVGDRRHEGITMAWLGSLYAALDDVTQAATLLGRAELQLKDVGDPLLTVAAQIHQGALEACRARAFASKGDAVSSDQHRRAALMRLELARAPQPLATPAGGKPALQRSVTQPLALRPAANRSVTLPTALAATTARTVADVSDEVRLAVRVVSQALQPPAST